MKGIRGSLDWYLVKKGCIILDPATWATTGISTLYLGLVLGEVPPASQVFQENTTRKATVIGYKSNPV